MKRVLKLTFVILFIILLNKESFSQRSQWSVANDGFWIERTQGSETKNFFGIGVWSNNWPQSTEACVRWPSKNEFTSAREIFNLMGIRYNLYTWNDCIAFPDWLTTVGSESVLLTGQGDISYRLRVGSGLNENGGVLGPVDQANMVANLYGSTLVNDAITDILSYSSASGAGSSDLMLFISDEPDRGFGNWHFKKETLSLFSNSDIVSDNNLVTYVDLGPVTGSNYLFQKYYDDCVLVGMLQCPSYPSNTLSSYGGFSHSYTLEIYNLIQTADYYKDTADILGVNSYSTTSRRPRNLGLYVKSIHQATNNKPVLPWIGVQCANYGDDWSNNEPPECTDGDLDFKYYKRIRAQAFSALINRSSGVMFYPERLTVSHKRWDEVLDIAKELNHYKYIIENGTIVSNSISSSSESITLKIDTLSFIFKLQYSDTSSVVEYYTDSNSTRKTLNYPKNLGFEQYADNSTGLSGNWKIWNVLDPDTDVRINTDTAKVKIGAKSLYLKDESNNGRVAVEQWFDIVPGLKYQVQAWNKAIAGYQRLIMQFYSNTGWIEEHQVVNGYVNPSSTPDWKLLKTQEVVAPPNATKIKLYIGTTYANYQSIPNEGYWDDVMVKIVGKGQTQTNVTKAVELVEEINTFKLNQNYPNPFNPQTTIDYSIAQSGHINIKVYNSLGQLVDLLVNGYKESGSYQVTFDGSNLSSGIYFYEIQSGNRVIRKRMTLIK